jgi:hypothetical protein
MSGIRTAASDAGRRVKEAVCGGSAEGPQGRMGERRDLKRDSSVAVNRGIRLVLIL